jgi:hypothetical protein
LRAYLAGVWAFKHSSSVEQSIKLIGDERIWSLAKSEQETGVAFWCELIDSREELGEVYSFALGNPGKYSCLLSALQREANRRGWNISLTVTNDLSITNETNVATTVRS